jgi:hypothetical protein
MGTCENQNEFSYTLKIDVVVREMQVGLTRDILAQASQLLVNRLLLLLTGVETRA